MKTLPDRIATRNLDGKPIMIFRGETGYYPLWDDFDIDLFNKYKGADEEIIKVMTAASMFGWDIPAVTKWRDK